MKLPVSIFWTDRSDTAVSLEGSAAAAVQLLTGQTVSSLELELELELS